MNIPKLKRNLAERLPFTNSYKFVKQAKRSLENVDRETLKLISAILIGIGTDKSTSRFAIQPYKLLCLKNICEEFKPNKIIEFGSGASTPIFGTYAEEHEAAVTSIEAHAGWLKTSQDLVKKFVKDDSIIEFKVCDNSWDFEQNPPMVSYNGIPEKDWDLVFIDGPTLSHDGTEYKNAICADIIKILENGFKGVIVVDMRKPTADWLNKNLPNGWKKNMSDIYLLNPKENFNYFSIFHFEG